MKSVLKNLYLCRTEHIKCTTVLNWAFEMKSVEDKTWNIFKFQIHEKSLSIIRKVCQMKSVEDKNWNIFKFKNEKV